MSLRYTVCEFDAILYEADVYRWRTPENLKCTFKFQTVKDLHQCYSLIEDLKRYYFNNLEEKGNIDIHTLDEADEVINNLVWNISVTQSTQKSKVIETWDRETHQLFITLPKRGRYNERWTNHCLRSLKNQQCYEKLKGLRNKVKRETLEYIQRYEEMRRREREQGCVVM